MLMINAENGFKLHGWIVNCSGHPTSAHRLGLVRFSQGTYIFSTHYLVSHYLVSDYLMSDYLVSDYLMSDYLVSDYLVSDYLVSDYLMSDNSYSYSYISYIYWYTGWSVVVAHIYLQCKTTCVDAHTKRVPGNIFSEGRPLLIAFSPVIVHVKYITKLSIKRDA